MPLQHPLELRFATLPLVLCGPIVRRVEPDTVSIWVALKEARNIVLEVYSGYYSPKADPLQKKAADFKSKKTLTSEIGKNLHLALVTIQSIPSPGPGELSSPVMLTHGGIFSYNLFFFKTSNQSEIEDENLLSLGLLNETEKLGFIPGQLPSFIVAPEKLEDLRIAHGSCRKPHGKGRDGLATLASVIEPDFTDPARVLKPTARPHYFFHTGDQIYADDCSNFLIEHYTDAGNFLLQKVEEVPFPVVPEDYFSKQGTKETDFVWVPVTSTAFPPSRRALNFYSGMTGDQANHLMSFAEYCAAYLFQWCDVLWPPDLPQSKDVFIDKISDHPSTRKYLLRLTNDGTQGSSEDPEVPANWENLDNDSRHLLLTPEPTNAVLLKALKNYIKDHQQETALDPPKERERVTEFKNGLKAVRRVLANMPSIMSFDDHDVTDDWFLNGGWTKRALGSRLGETVIRNGMLAFAFFQAWGNDPKGWADKSENRNARSQLMAEGLKLVSGFKPFSPFPEISPPRTASYSDIAKPFRTAFGFVKYEGPPEKDPRVKWHCSFGIGPTRVFVLDTRTRRDFSQGPDFPPNLISKDALLEQIPDNALPFGTELAIVVSGAPVLGLAVLESIGQPIVSRVLDVKNTLSDKFNIEKREAGHKRGSDSLDVEHWSIHVAGFEAMLKRCATLKKVMFLAGDVHYGITSEMDYWMKDVPEAARFVQMVSSSLKNIKPTGQLTGLLPSAIAQNALSGGLNYEFARLTSLGWEKEEDIKKLKLRLQTEPGKFADVRPGQFPVRLAYALARKPVFIPLRDWPQHEFKLQSSETKILDRIVFKKDCPEPSFLWKMNVLFDDRPDSVRFRDVLSAIQNLAIDLPKNENNGEAYKEGLRKILLRNSFYSRNHINRFVNWYSHVAIIHFERRGLEMMALHSLFYNPQLPPPYNNHHGTMESPFFRHEASLSTKPINTRPPFPLETV